MTRPATILARTVAHDLTLYDTTIPEGGCCCCY